MVLPGWGGEVSGLFLFCFFLRGVQGGGAYRGGVFFEQHFGCCLLVYLIWVLYCPMVEDGLVRKRLCRRCQMIVFVVVLISDLEWQSRDRDVVLEELGAKTISQTTGLTNVWMWGARGALGLILSPWWVASFRHR